MSACLLQNSGTFHMLKDDLESFLHVLSWATLCYVPAINSYTTDNCAEDLKKFNEHEVYQGGTDHGGLSKSNSLGCGTYPSRCFQPKKPIPLFDLLIELNMPFQTSYSQWAPSAEDQTKISKPISKFDNPTLELIGKIIHCNKG